MHSTAHLYDEIKYLSLQFIHFEQLIAHRKGYSMKLLSIFFLVLFNIKVFDTAKCCINNLFTFNEQLKQRPTIKKFVVLLYGIVSTL